MSDLGKNGFEWTGYTEPFIVPTNITITASQISTQNLGITGINGAVPIEYTINKNSGLYVRAFNTITGTSFLSKDINFDTKMEHTSERFIINVGGTLVSIDSVIYNNITEQYTISLSTSVTTIAGKSYKVIAKLVDISNISASKIYTAGEKVIEPYPFIA